MTRDTLGSIVRVARSPTAKWVAGAVLSGVLAVAGWALTLASEVARKPDVAAAVAVHDHGHAEALPKDGDGRLRPSHEDLVTGLAAARATIRLLEQHQVQVAGPQRVVWPDPIAMLPSISINTLK